MKRKSLIIVLIVTAAIFLTFVPVKSHAAVPLGFSDANIVYAGPLFGKIIIKVDAVDGSFTNQWLELNPAMQNSLLAVALSAISLQQPVRIWVQNDPHVIAGITVQTCYSILLVE
jgi:hypothetical protein